MKLYDIRDVPYIMSRSGRAGGCEEIRLAKQ